MLANVGVKGSALEHGIGSLLTVAELGGTTFPESETDHPSGRPG
jgi:hypothetical protein